MGKQLKHSQEVYTPVEVDMDCPFWVQVWRHSNEGRKARRARAEEERRLRQVETVVNVIMAGVLAFGVAVLLGLIG